MNNKTKYIVEAGIIAALYIVLSVISNALGLASGPVQLRLSEALCILPCFFASAIPGLFIGCLLSNVISGCVIWDVVFGSLATLLGALGTRAFKHNRYLASLPPVISNAVIIPIVLVKAYGITKGYAALMLSIAFSEFIACAVLGQLVYSINKRIGKNYF